MDLDDGHGNALPSVRAPMLMSKTPLAYKRPSPRLGEHTAEILAELEKHWRMKTGGQLIVDALEANGVDRLYCVPGESFLAVLDALHDSPIRTIVCRQEGGAAMMADCHGKLTGRPGICFVTRGPGATNASAGIHIAMQDSTPVIMFIGQIARRIRDREAFQEVDYRQFFGGVAKWVTEIDDPARIPELVTRAFAVATSGRPGPVIVALPEDVLTELAEAPAALPHMPVETRPGEAELDQLAALLGKAERPIAILGGVALERRCSRLVPEIRRSLVAAGRLLVPPSDAVRPSASELRRRCRHRHQSKARDLHQAIRPRAADRRPAR